MAQVGLGLFLLFLGAVSQNEKSRLNVAICDETDIPASVLNAAHQHTERIFDRAGVDLVWIRLDVRNQCAIPTGARRLFIVTILSKAPGDWTSPDAMGPTQASAFPRAYVFYNTVGIAVNIMQPPYQRAEGLGLMLGHAIAHELGHLILGNGHSVTGIMSTQWEYIHWQYIAAGQLLFDDKQAEAIQRRLGK